MFISCHDKPLILQMNIVARSNLQNNKVNNFNQLQHSKHVQQQPGMAFLEVIEIICARIGHLTGSLNIIVNVFNGLCLYVFAQLCQKNRTSVNPAPL